MTTKKKIILASALTTFWAVGALVLWEYTCDIAAEAKASQQIARENGTVEEVSNSE